MRRDALKILGGTLLAVALLAYVFRDVAFGDLVEALAAVRWEGLALAGGVMLAHNFFRVWRWRLLLHPVRPALPFRPLFVAVILGYLVTWVIPGRLGELVRPAYLAARLDVPLGPTLGSVMVDRIMDGAAILALFSAGVWSTPVEAGLRGHLNQIRNASLILLAVSVSVLGILVLLGVYREPLRAWISGRGPLTARVGRLALSMGEGADALRRPGLLAGILAHSLAAWLTIALGTWIGLRACGVSVAPGAVLVILPLLALGVAVPTPGGAGGYHGAMRFGLQLFGVAAIPAVAAGLLLHLAIVLPVVVLGVVLVIVDNLRWSDLIEMGRRFATLGREPAGEGGRG